MNEVKNKLKAIRIGLLGDTFVGKNSLSKVFSGLEFTLDNIAILGCEKFEVQLVLKNGEKIKIVLWDTAGQERFKSAALQTVKNVHGIIFVFDVTNKESFNNISNWMKDAEENTNAKFFVLFGNKADMPKEKWEINSEEVIKFAKEKNIKYFETSAKNNTGINEGFSYIANEIYDNKDIYNNNMISIKVEKNNSKCIGNKNKRK